MLSRIVTPPPPAMTTSGPVEYPLIQSSLTSPSFPEGSLHQNGHKQASTIIRSCRHKALIRPFIGSGLHARPMYNRCSWPHSWLTLRALRVRLKVIVKVSNEQGACQVGPDLSDPWHLGCDLGRDLCGSNRWGGTTWGLYGLPEVCRAC